MHHISQWILINYLSLWCDLQYWFIYHITIYYSWCCWISPVIGLCSGSSIFSLPRAPFSTETAHHLGCSTPRTKRRRLETQLPTQGPHSSAADAYWLPCARRGGQSAQWTNPPTCCSNPTSSAQGPDLNGVIRSQRSKVGVSKSGSTLWVWPSCEIISNS